MNRYVIDGPNDRWTDKYIDRYAPVGDGERAFGREVAADLPDNHAGRDKWTNM